MIHLREQICQNFHAVLYREWIEANGLGGYASSTILGLNSRRYHGLLVTALNPPVNRYVMVSKLEETLSINGDRYSLSTNQYPGKVYPEGYKYLKEFRLTPFPKFIYQIGEYRVEKTVFMVHGRNATVVKYLVHPDKGDIELYVRPMLAFRFYHALRSGNDPLHESVHIANKTVKVTPANPLLPPLYMYHCADIFREKGFWYNNFEYPEEAYRGYECYENLYNPGYFIYTFYQAQQYSGWLVLSTDPMPAADVRAIEEREISRRTKLVRTLDGDKQILEPLVLAADTFVVQRDTRPASSISAGYHWFGDWTRDTLIAYPGITLATGRFNIAKQILSTYGKQVTEGMLPNYFDDNNHPVYNAADASLLFFYALYKYVQYTDDYQFIEKLIPVLRSIIDAYTSGTMYGIRQNRFGLISFTESAMPLTWMDTVGPESNTHPRRGMVVEINALWYQALKIMQHLMVRFESFADAALYEQRAQEVRDQFMEIFWSDKLGYLYDFVDGDYREDCLRPSQILAAGLPFAVLPVECAQKVVSIVKQKLLTPFGLRTLDADNPCYAPHYRGGERNRKYAYHQGTVWVWLLGFYADALVYAHGRNEDTTDQITTLVKPLKEHLNVGCVGSISEIFDGNEPYFFRGAISQAWSVGEALRIHCEHLVHPDSREPLISADQIYHHN